MVEVRELSLFTFRGCLIPISLPKLNLVLHWGQCAHSDVNKRPEFHNGGPTKGRIWSCFARETNGKIVSSEEGGKETLQTTNPTNKTTSGPGRKKRSFEERFLPTTPVL